MARDKQDPRDHHLWKSPGGMIFLKLAVPAELRDRFPRSETGRLKDRITESTGTDSLGQARIFRDQRLAHWQRVFARLAGGGALSPEEIATERQRIRHGTLQTLLSMPQPPLTGAEMMVLDHLRSGFERWQQVPEVLAASTAQIRAIADEKYGPGVIAEGSQEWAEIYRVVVNAKIDAHKDHLISLFFPEVEQPATPAPILPANNGNGNGNLERFSVALEHFIAWMRDEQKARPATVAGYKSKAECFVKFANDPPLGGVDIDIAKAFLKHIAKTGAGDATVNHYHFVCRKVFEYTRTERHKFSGENPFSFKRRKAETKSKAKFTADELNKLFGSPTFTEREVAPAIHYVASALPWAAVIALYTGATREEICQLRKQDIRREAGVWIIDITPEAALSGALKRRARERIVPLHPELERLGLLKYLAALPRSAERLFPGLPLPKNDDDDKIGGALGRAFGRWRIKLGIKREGKKLDFHSFRHTFGKAIEDVGITAEDRARLLGHKIRGISSSVYSSPELKRVAPLIAKVKWAGLRIR